MSVRYSHPPEDGHDGVLLFDHLEDVATRVDYVVPDDARTPAGETLRDIVETLAWVHDFGKATRYFQRYLDVISGSIKREAYRHHAPLGAFAAYYALDAQEFETETCLAGFVAVAKHHGQLPDVAEYVFERTYRREKIEEENHIEQRQRIIGEQIVDIDAHAHELAEDVFREATDGAGSWKSFRYGFLDLLGEITSAVATSGGPPVLNRESLSDSCYGLVLECWGSLVLADKTGAAEGASDAEPSPAIYAADPPSFEILNDYVMDLEQAARADPDGTRSERLNHYRSQARKAVLEEAEQFADDGGGVATLTLPTGMGKTLSGLSAALTIRDRIEGERVIYALPFTSIIDQVIDEIEEIYKADTVGRLLTAHHHLSETTIRDEGNDREDDGSDADEDDRNDDVAGMLAESWRAGLTVTTFVQLFESLAGPSNKQSMKLPALRNSVVVLDEPQSLPLDWWKLVPRLVAMLTERYDATVIAMTATQPQLFEEETELVDDPDVYFEATERVAYEFDPSIERYIVEQSGPKSYASATAELLEAVEADESTLAICNTIDSARELTDHVTEVRPGIPNVGEVYADLLNDADDVDEVEPEDVAKAVESEGDQSVLHLSTRIRPIDRLALIETAKELTKNDHALIAVSTQLVEAGVDISFDRVYRDLAPIDSIVQAAGRCNRSFERNLGQVVVWWLDAPDEQEKTPAEAVYNRGPALLPAAADTLDSVRGDSELLDETVVARDAVEKYYERLHKEKDVGQDGYATYVDEARGDKLADLSLIDQRLAIDVVVCRTPEERDVIDSAEKAVDSYEFTKVNSFMEELRSKQISIPIYRTDSKEARELADLPPIHNETDARYVDPSKREFEKFFDPVTGFVVPDSTVDRRFL